jgi:pyruvate carboxylase
MNSAATRLQIGKTVNYRNAGTVEFLQDAETGKFYFIEVNPRIQVEHTVTEAVTGIDLVKAQIRIADGAKIGEEASGVPAQQDIHLTSHALQCRVTTEDPENNFSPDYGKITAYRSPAGFGIRLDAGTAYAGAILTRSYDSMLVKVTAWAPNPVEAIARMHRALWEFRIRGVATNLRFLDQVITHPKFANAEYTTKFIDETPELFKWEKKRDRATRVLSFIGDTIVNGNPEVKGRLKPKQMTLARLPKVNVAKAPPPGTKQKFDQLGAKGFADWMLKQEGVLITDTSMRDAHQSLLATRMRQQDMVAIAPYYAHMLPQLFSVECWGGATFDVAARFSGRSVVTAGTPRCDAEPAAADAAALGQCRGLYQLPRQRGARLRQAGRDLRGGRVPRIRFAELGREHARGHRRGTGNGQAVVKRRSATPATCPHPETKYARLLPEDGARAEGRRHPHPRHQGHGGSVPAERRIHLVKALKEELKIPVHFHTHDTSGIAAASVLAAVAAGCDAVDGAIDAMSGFTSQPNLGSIIEALRYSPRDPGIDHGSVRAISMDWEQVRKNYLAFESDMRSGASEVYVHDMPGGHTGAPGKQLTLRPRRFALAGSVTDLCRRQRDVRQHRQGHALEGGR